MSDGPGLTQLASQVGMSGKIGLLISRDPDFFSLLDRRGSYTVWIAEDDEGKIIGSFSETKQFLFINGKKRRISYLADLRVLPQYQGGTLAFRLVNRMRDELIKEEVDLLYCTTAEGNRQVRDFFDGRMSIPLFRKLGTFMVRQLIPAQHKSTNGSSLASDQELHNFYESFYSNYKFHPPLDEFSHCIHFISRKGKEIEAAISVTDPSDLKQHVLVHYPFMVSVSLKLLRLAKAFMPLPSLPSKGKPLRILYARYIGYKPGLETELADLIGQVRNYAFKNNYHLISIALDEKDKALGDIISPKSRFLFRSDAWIASLQRNYKLLEEISSGMLYEDYSLV